MPCTEHLVSGVSTPSTVTASPSHETTARKSNWQVIEHFGAKNKPALSSSLIAVSCNNTRCASMKCGFFPLKNTLNSEEWWFKVCSIACCTFSPSFGQFVNTMPGTIFSFWCERFVDAFFHIFVRTGALLSKCAKSSMQTSDNWKEASLVSKSHGVELSS